MYGIEEAREAILTSVKDLSDKQLNDEVEKGRWTVAQVLDHLFLMERGVTAQIKHELADDNSTSSDRKKPIEKALDRETKVEAPEPFRPSTEFLAQKGILAQFSESRKELLKVINGIEDKTVLSQKSAKHPVFGRIDLEQWIEFVGIHELRHLKQIEEIKVKF